MNTACLSVWQSASAFYLYSWKGGDCHQFAKKMQTFVAVDQTYITLILKMVGITYVAEFAMNICKDAGYAAVGNQIELFAKLSILVLSIPVLTVFLETVGSFL